MTAGTGMAGPRALLPESRGPLLSAYDAALLDLDGVLYVGRHAVPGARECVAAVREAGLRVGFVTNNASRSAEDVASHLSALGIPSAAADVVSSARAAARYLAERLPPGAGVLVVGAASLAAEVRHSGLRVVPNVDQAPQAVVQGFSPDVGWRELAEAAVAVSRGCLWVATNADASLPSERGPVPGNGALVAVVERATGRAPVVVGKPHPAMHREAMARARARSPVVVGDRLDTDIQGANAAGCDSMLVLTGVTAPADLLVAPPAQRPTFVASDVRGLLTAHPPTAARRGDAACAGWQAVQRDGVLRLRRVHPPAGSGAAGLEDDALRALCASAWTGREPVARVQPQDAAAREALRHLGL